MLTPFLKILPIIFIFCIGYFLKQRKFFKPTDADLFLKLNFLVGAPALVLLSMSSIKLDANLILIPFVAILLVLITFVISWVTGNNLLKLSKGELGVLLVGTMIVNTGFTIPFIISAYGDEGLARIILFDFGSELVAITLVYYLACHFGKTTQKPIESIKKVLFSPLFIALILGACLNIFHVRLPEVISTTLERLGGILVPLVILSLGIRFSPHIHKLKKVIVGIIVRMGVGLLLGILLSSTFHLEGLSRMVTIITAASPIGYMTLTFSSMEKLDEEYAASLVSLSILIGLVLVPVLIVISNLITGT